MSATDLTYAKNESFASVYPNEALVLGTRTLPTAIQTKINNRKATVLERTGISSQEDPLKTFANALQSRVFTSFGNVETTLTNVVTDTGKVNDALGVEATNRINADDSLQSELDTTQVGAGLAANGNYEANASSNYLQNALSLKDADNKLDAKVRMNTDMIALEVGDRKSAVAQEVFDRDMAINIAKNALQSNIDTESNTRASQITALSAAYQTADNAINAELTATQVGAGLATTGDYTPHASDVTHIGDATSLHDADKKLDIAIKVEEIRALVAESELDAKIDNVISNTDPAQLDSLTEIVSAFQSADSGLAGTVNSLDTTRATQLGELGTVTVGNTTRSYTGVGNYIAGTSNLSAAIGALDTQLKTTVDGLAENDSSKVAKLGDTMTGDLVVNADITTTGKMCFYNNGGIDIYGGVNDQTTDANGYSINSNVNSSADYGMVIEGKNGSGILEEILTFYSSNSNIATRQVNSKNKGIYVSGVVNVTQELKVGADARVDGHLNMGGNGDIEGHLNVAAGLDVSGLTTFGGPVVVNTGDITVASGGIQVSGNTLCNGGLEVIGATTLNGPLTMNSNITLDNTANLTANGNVSLGPSSTLTIGVKANPTDPADVPVPTNVATYIESLREDLDLLQAYVYATA